MLYASDPLRWKQDLIFGYPFTQIQWQLILHNNFVVILRVILDFESAHM